MRRLLKRLFDVLNDVSPVLVQTPRHRSFGNAGEEIFFGLLRAQRENKRVLFVYPRAILAPLLTVTNRELFHLRHDRAVSNDTAPAALAGTLLTLLYVWTAALQRLHLSRSDGPFDIGRDRLWKPRDANAISCDALEALAWRRLYNQYAPPVLAPERIRRAETIRARLGIPADRWFVCMHVRGAMPPNLRDSSIENYFGAIEAITSRGGWVVRLGDARVTPLPSMPRVVDYAHSPLKCDLMDMYLMSRCRFFLGTEAGPTAVAMLFNRPMVLVNLTEWSHFAPMGPSDLAIIKHIYSRPHGRLLGLREIFDAPFTVQAFNRFGTPDFEFVENTADEIREVVDEFLTRGDDTRTDLQLWVEELRRRHVWRGLEAGEPNWHDIPAGDHVVEQYRIAARDAARGTFGRQYLERHWDGDRLHNGHAVTVSAGTTVR